MVNSPLIRPAISWGGGIGGVPLGSHDFFQNVQNFRHLLSATSGQRMHRPRIATPRLMGIRQKKSLKKTYDV